MEASRLGRTCTTVEPVVEGDRTVSLVALTPGLCPVDDDPQQPGPERRPEFEAVDPVDDRQQGVLDDVLRRLGAGDVDERHPHHRLVMAVEQRPEGRLVAGPQTLHELDVVHVDRENGLG